MKRALSAAVVVIIFLAFSFIVTPAQAAVLFPTTPVKSLDTSVTDQLVADASSACTYQKWMYVFEVDAVTFKVNVITSLDGVSWSVPTYTGLTMTNLQTFSAAHSRFQFVTCNGQSVVFSWLLNFGAGPSTNFVDYVVGALGGGTVTIGATVTGPLSQNGYPIHANLASNGIVMGAARILNGIVFYSIFPVSGAGHQFYVENNIDQVNDSSTWASLPAVLDFAWSGSQYMVYEMSDCAFRTSANGLAWTAQVTFSTCISPETSQAPAYDAVTGFGGNFYAAYLKFSAPNYYAVFDTINVANGQTANPQLIGTSLSASGSLVLTTDALTNFVMIFVVTGGASSLYWYSTNTGSSFTTTQSFITSGTYQLATDGTQYLGLEPIFSAQLETFPLTTETFANPFTVYEVTFGSVTLSPVSQTQTLGICAAGATGVFTTHAAGSFTMANSTVYVYYGAQLGGLETVNQIQVAVNHTIGSGPHTLQLLLFTSNSPTIGAGTPLILEAYSLPNYVLSSGTSADTVTWNIGIGLAQSFFAGNIYGVGVVGDSKIVLATSAVSGLYTQTGQPSNALQTNAAAGYTSLGSSVGTELYLCAQSNYQSVQVITQTVTTTSISIITGSGTGTVTATVTSVNNSGVPQYPLGSLLLDIIVVLGPALILGGATKSGMGAVLGAVMGTGIGVWVGIVPFYWIAILSLALVAMIFVGRGSGGGGGM